VISFHVFYFIKSSIETPNALANFAIINTDGFFITLLSIFVKVVYLTPDFLAKSSCDKPCFVRYFFTFSPMLISVVIFSINISDMVFFQYNDNK